jgi:hypothetical protein
VVSSDEHALLYPAMTFPSMIRMAQVVALRKDTASALGERLSSYQVPSDGRRPGGGGRTAGNALSLGGARAPGRGLQLDIERLFNQKQRFSTPIVFAVASIVEGVLKLVFKTNVECVRLITFGRHGFQQIQVRAAM